MGHFPKSRGKSGETVIFVLPVFFIISKNILLFFPQVHPHLQTWLGRTSYSGHWETQLRSVGLIPFDINEKRLFSFGDVERQSRIRRKLGVPTIGKTWQR